MAYCLLFALECLLLLSVSGISGIHVSVEAYIYRFRRIFSEGVDGNILVISVGPSISPLVTYNRFRASAKFYLKSLWGGSPSFSCNTYFRNSSYSANKNPRPNFWGSRGPKTPSGASSIDTPIFGPFLAQYYQFTSTYHISVLVNRKIDF